MRQWFNISKHPLDKIRLYLTKTAIPQYNYGSGLYTIYIHLHIVVFRSRTVEITKDNFNLLALPHRIGDLMEDGKTIDRTCLSSLRTADTFRSDTSLTIAACTLANWMCPDLIKKQQTLLVWVRGTTWTTMPAKYFKCTVCPSFHFPPNLWEFILIAKQ